VPKSSAPAAPCQLQVECAADTFRRPAPPSPRVASRVPLHAGPAVDRVAVSGVPALQLRRWSPAARGAELRAAPPVRFVLRLAREPIALWEPRLLDGESCAASAPSCAPSCAQSVRCESSPVGAETVEETATPPAPPPPTPMPPAPTLPAPLPPAPPPTFPTCGERPSVGDGTEALATPVAVEQGAEWPPRRRASRSSMRAMSSCLAAPAVLVDAAEGEAATGASSCGEGAPCLREMAETSWIDGQRQCKP